MRDGDAAWKAGLVLLLARPRVPEEGVGVGGASFGDDARGERSDDRRLVGAEPHVKADELGGDGLGHDDLQWPVLRLSSAVDGFR